MSTILKTYYQLTKPGIIYGNDITAIAGFFLASKGHIVIPLFLAMLLGISLVIASACVFNNYLDQGIDEKMERTKKRGLVTGSVSSKNAIIYAIILGLLGFGILARFTNMLTVIIGLIGYVDYIVLYGIGKRKSIHGTLIGSISGAMPIVAGYTAVTNRFDLGALLLFLILAAWQMPHFYAIAIYRLKDYKEAGIPVLPAKKSIVHTKIQIFLYMLLYVIATLLLTIFHYTGLFYFSFMALCGIIWLWMSVQGFWSRDTNKWARKVFFFSLLTILIFSTALFIDGFLWK